MAKKDTLLHDTGPGFTGALQTAGISRPGVTSPVTDHFPVVVLNCGWIWKSAPNLCTSWFEMKSIPKTEVCRELPYSANSVYYWTTNLEAPGLSIYSQKLSISESPSVNQVDCFVI
jgi:hypothetical protein